MWTGAGLLLDEDDLVVASNTAEVDEHLIREDMSGNALIWLVSKMASFLTAQANILNLILSR